VQSPTTSPVSYRLVKKPLYVRYFRDQYGRLIRRTYYQLVRVPVEGSYHSAGSEAAAPVDSQIVAEKYDDQVVDSYDAAAPDAGHKKCTPKTTYDAPTQ